MTVGLSGTLSADDILSQAEALRKEQEAMLAQRTAAATQAAQQAQSQFQQASEQPPADINPTDAFVQTLLGNLASTIGGEPSYREKAQENLKLSRVSLIQQRKANLEALQGAAERSAKAAQEAGDHEQEVKIRSQIESRNRALDQLNQEENRRQRMDIARMNAENKVGAQENDDDIATIAESILSGQSDLTAYPIRLRSRIVRYMADTGQKMTPKKVREAKAMLGPALGVLDEIEGLSSLVNTSKGVKRFGAGIGATIGAITQNNPEAQALQNARRGFLASIARAAGEKGVLTEQDVSRAQALLPSLFDTREVAQNKIKRLRSFLSSIEERATQAYTDKRGATTAGANDNDPLGVRK